MSRGFLRIFSKSSGEERGFGGNSRVSHQAFADGEFDAVGGGHGAGEDAEHLAGAPLDGKSHVVLRRASGAVNSARSMEKIRPLQTVLQRPTALRYQAEIRRSDLFWHLADLRPPPRFAFATSTRHSGHDISRDVRDRHDVRRRRQGGRAPLQPRHLQTGAPATPIAHPRLFSQDTSITPVIN